MTETTPTANSGEGLLKRCFWHPLLRLLRWLFSWRILRRCLFALACLLTLVALFVTEENWRGKRAWEKFSREWEAKGEHFDLESVSPPPVPDEQNFFMAPIFAGAFSGKLDPATGEWEPDSKFDARFNVTIYKDQLAAKSPEFGGWQKSHKTDLAAWQRYYRSAAAGPPRASANKARPKPAVGFPVAPQPQTPAADVLLALTRSAPTMEELRQAALRPYSRAPRHFDDGSSYTAALLVPLVKFKNCAQFLQLRADALLADGQTDQALADVKLSLRLLWCLKKEPLVIEHMVRLALLTPALEPVWEGLADHRWSESHLASLEQELNKLDFLADYPAMMRGERAFSLWMLGGTWRMGGWLPSGWLYQNRIALCQMHFQWLLPMVDVQQRMVSPQAMRRISAQFRSAHQRVSPYDFFSASVFPAIGRIAEKFARAQSALDLARVACALERYRLARGRYPETLDPLVPQFLEKLPHDVITGQPLKYRLIADGQFLLYSVGWNETDDGGTVASTKDGGADWEKGDWVWRYPKTE